MTQEVRVMHFADTHFGVELYGRLDPATGLNTRLQDFKRSLMEAIEKALDLDVHLAVFAGDAYKTRDPRQTDQREFAACIRRLTEAGVPVVLLAGNHDMPSVRGRANAVEIYRTLGVTGVHVVHRPELTLIQTRVGPVRIAPMPYLMKGISVAREEFQGKTLDETRLLMEGKYVQYLGDLVDEIREANDDIPTLLVGHFWVNGARLSSWQQGYFNDLEPKVPLAALTDPAFDYVALGHIHKHQDLNPHAQPHVVYCGSPDRIDFGEKDEEKGFVLVHLRKGGAEYEFIPVTGSRQMLDIQVDADCDEPTERILAEIKRHPLRNAIVKVSYKIGHERQALVREKELREALQNAFMTVTISRRVQRDVTERSRQFNETRTPREALELYIERTEKLTPHRDRLLQFAEPLLQAVHEQDV
jgi:exonuclease SbcD